MTTIDPLDTLAHEQAEADLQEKLAFTKRVEQDDYKWLMSDKRGRRIFSRLLDTTGVYRSSFTGNSETFFREGARNVGLQLMAKVQEYCPEKYDLMVTEQRKNDHGTNQR